MDCKLLLIDDPELIRVTMSHPKVWPHISEKHSSIPKEFDGLNHWGVFSDDNYHGFFRLDWVTGLVLEMHTVLLPSARGIVSKISRCKLEEIVRKWYPACNVVITKIPSYNRLAVKYAKDGGMEEMGIIKNGWDGHSGVCDLVMMQKEMR